MRNLFLYTALGSILLLSFLIYWNSNFGWLAIIIAPLLIKGFADYFQKSDNIRRNYPLFGSLSRLVEEQRHVLQEVLLMNRTEGKPFNLIEKEIAFKRAADHI